MTIFSLKNTAVGVVVALVSGFYVHNNLNVDRHQKVNALPALASEQSDSVFADSTSFRVIRTTENIRPTAIAASTTEPTKRTIDVSQTKSEVSVSNEFNRDAESAGAPVAEKETPKEETAYLNSESQLVETAFLSEPYDASWAPAVEAEVWNDFEKSDLQTSRLDSVDCRTTVCRIEISHQDQQAQSEFLVQMAQQANGRSGTVHQIDGSDSLATLIYLSK